MPLAAHPPASDDPRPMQPNRRVTALSLSRTIALDTRAKELAAAGRDVLNLTAGEPDFEAPAVVRAAAHKAIDGGDVRYTPAGGRLRLREAVARHLEQTRGIRYAATEIVICHSAKHALANTILSLVEPGDEVLLPLPAWTSYEEQVRFAGGVPVGVLPRADLGPDLDALRAAIGPATRGIFLNTPCNPSGYCLSSDEVRAIGELAVERDLWILSDEIYSRLVYGEVRHMSPAQISPAVRERTVLVDGASKAFAMTGYRIGYLAAPRSVADACVRLQSQTTGAPNAISQDALEAGLSGEPPEMAEMVREFDARRRLVCEALDAMGLPTPLPGGAFYAFPSVAHLCDARGADGFCEELLESTGLALVPGSAFGLDGYVRISYAASRVVLERALERLASFVGSRVRA